MEQKMLTVPGLAVRNLRHRRVRTMFLGSTGADFIGSAVYQ